MMVLAFVVVLVMASCKKNDVKTISVDTKFAVSLYQDTIVMAQFLDMMDSTSSNWLRINEDGSLSAFYCDSLSDVLKASDLLGNIDDVTFATSTEFELPGVPSIPVPIPGTIDTVVAFDNLASIPFEFEGFGINTVEFRDGNLTVNLAIQPAIPAIQKIVLSSEAIILASGEPISFEIIPSAKNQISIDLAGCVVQPDENQNVIFDGELYLSFDLHSGLDGGTYNCVVDGSITDVKFKTLIGSIDKGIDTLFADSQPMDFGIQGISGEAWLPVPTIMASYRNTFGLGVECDILDLDFYSSITGGTVNLLAADSVPVAVNPTGDSYQDYQIEGFVSQIDVLGQYTMLNFGAHTYLNFGTGTVSVSDTSKVDVAVGIDLPISFNINDLEYSKVLDFSIGDVEGDETVEKFFDEIDFYINTYSMIPLNLEMELEFLKTTDPSFSVSFFEEPWAITYNANSEVEIDITGDKLNQVQEADQVKITIKVDTPEEVGQTILRKSDYLKVGVKMQTITHDINL